jgi:hypothetical protein
MYRCEAANAPAPEYFLVGGEERVPVVYEHDAEEVRLWRCHVEVSRALDAGGRGHHGRFKVVEAEDPVRALNVGGSEKHKAKSKTTTTTFPTAVLYHSAFNQSQLVVLFILAAVKKQ